MDLKEIVEALSKLPEGEREAMVEEVTRATADMKWLPNPGPQTEAYFHPADEIFYGGQAGGGKTDLLIGLAITAHYSALLLRRTNKEANGLVERMTQILGSRDGWSSQPGIWRVGDRNVEISGCQLEEDKQKFKGNPHDLYCVAPDTPVLMGDKSWRQIQDILPGDEVETLEGPRRVTKTYRLPPRPAVEVLIRRPRGGSTQQIQSKNHQLLTPTGWVAPGMQADAHQELLLSRDATRCHDPNTVSPMTLRTRESSVKAPHSSSASGRSTGPLRQAVRCTSCSSGRPDSSAGRALRGQETYCEASGDAPREIPQRGRFHRVLPELLRRWRDSASSLVRRLSHAHGGAGVQTASRSPDSLDDCPFCFRSGDEHTLAPGKSLSTPMPDRRGPLQQADAARCTPTDSRRDGPGTAPRRNRRTVQYVHPYTKEIRWADHSLFSHPCSVSPVGLLELCDIEVEEVNHFITYGGLVNKNCFDEVSDFSESQYVFITGWNRTTRKGQRCRIVVAGNPPTRPEGLWVIKRWAAWLDPNHPNPAKPGELRWYTMGPDEREIEVNGPGPHMVGGEWVVARSRTFIPAQLSDNPDLADTNYKSVLDGLPPELRAAYRDGRFDLGLKDRDFQVIPTAWVRAAQLRWTARPPEDAPMCAMGVDVSGGGTDPMEIARRHDGWYDKIIEVPGREIPMDRAGAHCAGLIISHRRDSARVIIDLGGGYGGSTYEQLKANGIDAIGYIGSGEGMGRTREGGFEFHNRRSAAIWKFREALDPGQPGGSPVMLPDDPTLVADLTAPTYEIVGRKVKVESKLDLKKRLGRSTDRGDAVIMAWTSGLKTANVQGGFKEFRNRMPSVVRKAPKRTTG